MEANKYQGSAYESVSSQILFILIAFVFDRVGFQGQTHRNGAKFFIGALERGCTMVGRRFTMGRSAEASIKMLADAGFAGAAIVTNWQWTCSEVILIVFLILPEMHRASLGAFVFGGSAKRPRPNNPKIVSRLPGRCDDRASCAWLCSVALGYARRSPARPGATKHNQAQPGTTMHNHAHQAKPGTTMHNQVQ